MHKVDATPEVKKTGKDLHPLTVTSLTQTDVITIESLYTTIF